MGLYNYAIGLIGPSFRKAKIFSLIPPSESVDLVKYFPALHLLWLTGRFISEPCAR
jgi:hypothetical protein